MMMLMKVEDDGTLTPQDKEYVSMAALISDMRQMPEVFGLKRRYTLHEVRPILSIACDTKYTIVKEGGAE